MPALGELEPLLNQSYNWQAKKALGDLPWVLPWVIDLRRMAPCLDGSSGL